ncbi:vgrG protein [Marinomonas sp. MED121]|uniref:type VI secretion system Vgr family protein n=1 Tax=Marinomonas sp. MED121 TaxID=314277 RepID=UPI000069002E|nr:type VI secretion system tip protein TssI/VgrG [Marinomonas sp. MED121]EAQ66637.1 vgrG protein [Marinomonas sp. MED121]
MELQSGLRFTLQIEGMDENTFVVRGFEGVESLSQPFEFVVELASRVENHSPLDILDKGVSLSVFNDGEEQQTWHGVVKQFSQGDTGHHHTFYQLIMVPSLSRSGLRQNSRIFQLQTVPEIISILLQEMGIDDYAFSMLRECEPREFCAQYRETDLDFIQRIAAEEGLFFFFSHVAEKHTLIFSDNNQALPNISETCAYNANAAGGKGAPFVQAFKRLDQIAPSNVTLKDYSFKQPDYSFLQTANTDALSHYYEFFDAPGRFKEDESGKAFTLYRLQSLRKHSAIALAQSNIASLTAGAKMLLERHPDDDCNQDWLLTRVVHKGEQPQALEEMGGEGLTYYRNKVEVIPSEMSWRADINGKPRIDGAQIAIVVGPEGEEIYCDEFGRVKVQFPWDRYANGDDLASCWVRVSSLWAGSMYGVVSMPRIGHEVVVEYLEGDPDQPIITGRAFNAMSLPPYALPEHMSKTVLRTQSHQGEGYNEIAFEDQAEQELISVIAQKDLNLTVLNDRIDTVDHDVHLAIENNRSQTVNANHHLKVEAEQRVKVKGNKESDVAANLQRKQAKALLLDAGLDIALTGASNVVIDAGNEITLSAGGSFVKVDAAGVHVSGAAINLN